MSPILNMIHKEYLSDLTSLTYYTISMGIWWPWKKHNTVKITLNIRIFAHHSFWRSRQCLMFTILFSLVSARILLSFVHALEIDSHFSVLRISSCLVCVRSSRMYIRVFFLALSWPRRLSGERCISWILLSVVVVVPLLQFGAFLVECDEFCQDHFPSLGSRGRASSWWVGARRHRCFRLSFPACHKSEGNFASNTVLALPASFHNPWASSPFVWLFSQAHSLAFGFSPGPSVFSLDPGWLLHTHFCVTCSNTAAVIWSTNLASFITSFICSLSCIVWLSSNSTAVLSGLAPLSIVSQDWALDWAAESGSSSVLEFTSSVPGEPGAIWLSVVHSLVTFSSVPCKILIVFLPPVGISKSWKNHM